MKAFYRTEERQKALRFHALELVDTPFAHNAMVPGCGIDCVHVNAWCYLKTGFLQEFNPPAYALDEGQHAKKSKLLKWLSESNLFEQHSGTPAGGDTVCFNMGLSEHHVGLMLTEKDCIHCLFFGPKKVIITDLQKEASYTRRMTAIYRPLDIKERILDAVFKPL